MSMDSVIQTNRDLTVYNEPQAYKQSVETQIKIIGFFPAFKKQTSQFVGVLEFQPGTKSFVPDNPKNNKCKVNPVQIYAEGNTLAFIDANKNAWVMGQTFSYPINLSLITKKKANKGYLNEKQIILQTKKLQILVNWGSKKIFENEELLKIQTYDRSMYQNFFQAYSILESNKNEQFFYSNLKKIQNSNKLYRVVNDCTEIIAYPTLQKFKFNNKILGLSIGKTHCLCWDIEGSLYSWGNRSLALGYKNLPDEDLVQHPKKITILKNFIKTAYASTNYSLAIGAEGGLYQWGIKKQINQMNEQLIFQPRKFNFKYFNCEKKFVSLKGKNQKFGIISATGQLYIWGEKTRRFIDSSACIPFEWQNGRLYQPFFINTFQNQKIIDFAIEQTYLVVITTDKNCTYTMKDEKQYWNHMISTVKTKFFHKKYKKISTQQNCVDNQQQQKNQNFLYRRSLCQTIQNHQNQRSAKTQRCDFFSKILEQKRNKQMYMKLAKQQPKIFQIIMKQTENQNKARQTTTLNRFRQRSIHKKDKSVDARIISERANKLKDRQKNLMSQFGNTMPQVFKQLKLQANKLLKKPKTSQKIMCFTASGSNFRKNMTKKDYEKKLQQVLRKKKELEMITFNQTLRKMQQNSLQFRMQRHLQIQEQKMHRKNTQVLKTTIYNYLIKNYLIKLFCAPLAQGRQIKIQNFGRNLKLQRIEKNIRKLFVKARIRFQMKKLHQMNFWRFTLFVTQFRKYVRRFRLRKFQKQKQFVVYELTKNFIKDKMKLGLNTTGMNIRKLQKFRQWLVLVKNERIKCLKYLWKIHLFSIMKINQENQKSVICHLPKNTNEITFQSLYQEKIQQNPNLKLQNFLNKSAVFRIKVQYFKTLSNLFTYQKKPLHKSQKIIKYLSNCKKAKIKFMDDQNQEHNKLNLMSVYTDIFPYSVHYNILTKPKNYDMIIPQIMKKNQKWIKQQKRILQKYLNLILRNHQIQFLKKNKEYDLELANFIKSKYDIFCEKRWKYIIEYNQIIKTYSKKKKERELTRILDQIGMKKLLNEDCLPQKHAIMDEALKRKDAPKPPNNFIQFGQKQFKQIFKLYYDNIHAKAKLIKKMQT